MSKKIIIIIAASVAVLVLLVFAGYKLYVGVSAFAEAEKNLQSSLLRLNRYYAGNPFPSQENIGKESANLKTLDDWFVTLVEGIRNGQLQESHERRPSKFIDTLTEKRNEIKALAGNVRPAVLLAADFAVGFKKYNSGDLPDPKYVPRLTQQLTVMDSVCRIMIESGVREIFAMQRENIEATSGRGVARGRSGGSSGRSARRPRPEDGATVRSSVFADDMKASKANPDAGIIAKGKLFTKFHFCYLIKADETSLVTLLNSLSESPMFLVVTKVSVQKDKNDIVLPEKEEEGEASGGLTGGALLASMLRRPSDDAGERESEVAPDVPAAPKVDLSREQKVVSGPAFEKLLDVLIEFDVYRFDKTEVSK